MIAGQGGIRHASVEFVCKEDDDICITEHLKEMLV